MPEKAKASPAKAEETPTDTPAQSVAEAGEPLTLSYAEPVEVDGGLRAGRLGVQPGAAGGVGTASAGAPLRLASRWPSAPTISG